MAKKSRDWRSQELCNCSHSSISLPSSSVCHDWKKEFIIFNWKAANSEDRRL